MRQKETNGLKIKQPENSEISLPKPAVPANWRLLNMEAYINLKTGKLEGSDAREFSKYFGKDIDRIISDNFSVGGAS